MKAKDIRELTTEEVQARIVEEREKLMRLRLNHAVSAIESPSEIRSVRKNIARLETVLVERSKSGEEN